MLVAIITKAICAIHFCHVRMSVTQKTIAMRTCKYVPIESEVPMMLKGHHPQSPSIGCETSLNSRLFPT